MSVILIYSKIRFLITIIFKQSLEHLYFAFTREVNSFEDTIIKINNQMDAMTSSSQIDIPEIDCSDQTAGKGAVIENIV